MAWKHIAKPETKRATHQLVESFTSMEKAPNDRPIKVKTRRVIETALAEGRFRSATLASCYCKATKKTYRVNGKHTSTVLSEMNGTMPKDLWLVIEQYEADTLQDVAELYATFDTKASIRTTGDINQAFAGSCPDLCEVPPRIVNLCVTGMSYFKWEGSYASQTAESRAMLAVEHKDFVLSTYLFFGGEGSGALAPLRRGSVCAAMFGTWNKNKKIHDEFWTLVRDESHPDRNNASRTLKRYLLTTTIKSQRAAKAEFKGDSLHAMYAKCIHAWNAYRRGETTSLKYYADKPTPSFV